MLKFNDAQADFHEKRTGKDALLKGRKVGFSKYFLGCDLADSVVLSGIEVRNVVQDPDTEKKFREAQMLMFENLPNHLRLATREYSGEHIWIHDTKAGSVDNHLVIRNVAAGHEGKGRGQAINRLRMTEVPFWKGNQKKTLVALMNAAPNADTSMESTPYGMELFFSTYQDGKKKKKGGWTSHKYEWWWQRAYRIENATFKKARGKFVLLNPGETISDVWKILPAGASEVARAANRSRFDAAVVTKQEMAVGRAIFDHLKRFNYLRPESIAVGRGAKQKLSRWNRPEVAEYIAWRRMKIGDIGEKDFLVEYLENDVDCFEQTGRPVVSQQFLKEPCEPVAPKDGREYVIGVDSSLGKSTSNHCAIAVIDVETGANVHSEKPLMSPDRLAYRVGELSELYNGATIAPERNNMGIAVIQKLCDLGYEDRIYRHLSERLKRLIDTGSLNVDEARQQADLGFPTSFEGAGSKSNAAMMLEESIRKKDMQPSALFCEEAKTVVWFDNGKLGAMPGYEDDLFMATLIANYVIRARESLTGGFVGVMPEVGYAR